MSVPVTTASLDDDDGFYQLCERIGTRAVAARILLHCARYAPDLVDLSRLEEIRRVAMAPYEERKARERMAAGGGDKTAGAADRRYPVENTGRTAEKLAEKAGVGAMCG